MEVVNIESKFSLFTDHWRPKVVAELNGQELKLVKIQGEFPWHSHDIDEMFIGWRGTFRLDTEQGPFTIGPGEFIVVPAGVQHRPVAVDEAQIFLLEPVGTRNTGNVVDDEFTAPDGVRI